MMFQKSKVFFSRFLLGILACSFFFASLSTFTPWGVFSREKSLYLRMEPAVLGIYTRGNEIVVFLTCSQFDGEIHSFEATIRSTNLVYKNAVAGSLFATSKMKITSGEEENTFHIAIEGIGKYSSLTNMNTLAVFVFLAKKEGTARFWMPDGTIEKEENSRASFQFLPSSFLVTEPIGTKIQLRLGIKQYTVNQKKKNFTTLPFLFQNRTMIPIRSIGEDMGAKIDWLDQSKTILIEYLPLRIEMKIGNLMVLINQKSRYLDVPPLLVKNQVFIPLRYLAETLGGTVSWSSQTQQITIRQ